jgi:hypothetical protein
MYAKLFSGRVSSVRPHRAEPPTIQSGILINFPVLLQEGSKNVSTRLNACGASLNPSQPTALQSAKPNVMDVIRMLAKNTKPIKWPGVFCKLFHCNNLPVGVAGFEPATSCSRSVGGEALTEAKCAITRAYTHPRANGACVFSVIRAGLRPQRPQARPSSSASPG